MAPIGRHEELAQRIQYRSELIDEFLAQTGLSIEFEPPKTETQAFQFQYACRSRSDP
jgi:hypothetical protein